ncbi:MAG: 3-hydroxyacyl-CoA dehydrogenase family protein, partial [Verrucomicrobia bacterium]|nr:3-hydroxyacyl-CoA dehydrogenase family protein [Verrucomicrobiota bacterium]
ELATAVKEPARFVGTHFFAPVEQMELLEIIRGAQTSPAIVKRALRLAGQMRKVPIVVGDGPGFYTSRVVMAYVQEALFLLREGVSPAFIDHVAQNAGMVIGPLAMADLTALDLLADIFRNLARHARGSGAQAGETVTLLERFIARGRLGKKVGAGIYNYENNRVVAWPELNSWFPPRFPALSAEAVRDRLFYIQAIETLRTLHEGVILDLAAADLASVLGWRFPDYRGGVMRALAGPGESAFASICSRLAEQFGPRFQLGR